MTEMIFDWEKIISNSSKKVRIDGFYKAALLEIIHGAELDDLNIILKDLEDEEMYEECEGLNKAIKLAKKSTKEQLKNEYKKR